MLRSCVASLAPINTIYEYQKHNYQRLEPQKEHQQSPPAMSTTEYHQRSGGQSGTAQVEQGSV
jgi:hypothetical protein